MLALIFAAALCLGAALPAFASDDGPKVQPHIVGGEPVADSKYRFIAALRDVTKGNTAYEQQFCGGALIDGDSVLTAAHCLETVTAAQLRVTVGITDLRKKQGQTRTVARIARHPNYIASAAGYRYDAAVLQLGSPVTGIKPVVIPAATSNNLESPGRDATVAGWGNTIRQPPNGDNGSSFPYRMRETQVPIVSDGVGQRVYGSSYAPALMVAAGREGKDTCQGDSGGPIFFSGENATYQVGITSFGDGCGARGYPGIYAETNASSIRNFIVDARD